MKSLNCLTKDCIELIHRNLMLKQLVKAELVQSTLEEVYLDPKTKDELLKSSLEKLGISDEESKVKWLEKNKLNLKSFETIALRDSKLKEYCKNNFNNKIESHFLNRKDELDVVIYSLIRTSDPYLAQELYQRVINNEEDFGSLATKYSEGIEKKTRGIIGPVAIQKSHPNLAEFLKRSIPGEISTPIKIEPFYLVVRLESYEPVQLDNLMREKMSIELFNNWAENEATNISEELLKKMTENSTPSK